MRTKKKTTRKQKRRGKNTSKTSEKFKLYSSKIIRIFILGMNSLKRYAQVATLIKFLTKKTTGDPQFEVQQGESNVLKSQQRRHQEVTQSFDKWRTICGLKIAEGGHLFAYKAVWHMKPFCCLEATKFCCLQTSSHVLFFKTYLPSIFGAESAAEKADTQRSQRYVAWARV